MTPQLAIFWLLAIISVVASLVMVRSRNPIRSALCLVATFLSIAVFYITLSAQFIAAVQIIVYAGAIMVLFLFVIMLLNMGAGQEMRDKGTLQTPIAIGLGVSFLVALLFSQRIVTLPRTNVSPELIDRMGEVQTIGANLYSPAQPWLFPFEITSILLLVAVVGAIIMAKRRI